MNSTGHEVVHRGALLQELGIRADVDLVLGPLLDRSAHQISRPHRNRALGDDDLPAVHGLADGPGHRQHVLQVRAAILTRRRAHGDEDDLRLPHRVRHIGREGEASLLQVPLHQRLETWLVDRDDPVPETFDLVDVDIGADDVVACVRQPRARHQPDIPCSYDRYVHSIRLGSCK